MLWNNLIAKFAVLVLMGSFCSDAFGEMVDHTKYAPKLISNSLNNPDATANSAADTKDYDFDEFLRQNNIPIDPNKPIEKEPEQPLESMLKRGETPAIGNSSPVRALPRDQSPFQPLPRPLEKNGTWAEDMIDPTQHLSDVEENDAIPMPLPLSDSASDLVKESENSEDKGAINSDESQAENNDQEPGQPESADQPTGLVDNTENEEVTDFSEWENLPSTTPNKEWPLLKIDLLAHNQIVEGDYPRWAFLLAAENNIAALKSVLRKISSRYDLNELRSNRGDTLLIYAVRHGQIDTVRLLLANGLEPEVTNYYGESPLVIALNNGRPDIVNAIAEMSVRKRQKLQKKPISLPEVSLVSSEEAALKIKENQERILNAAIEQDVTHAIAPATNDSAPSDQSEELQDPADLPPQQLAYELPGMDASRGERQVGAPSILIEDAGEIEIAEAPVPDCSLNELRCITNCGINATLQMREAIENYDLPSIYALISSNYNLNRLDSNYETPLMIAAKSGKIGIVKLLLRSGAKPEIRNIKGETASDISIKNNFPKIASLLTGS